MHFYFYFDTNESTYRRLAGGFYQSSLSSKSMRDHELSSNDILLMQFILFVGGLFWYRMMKHSLTHLPFTYQKEKKKAGCQNTDEKSQIPLEYCVVQP